MKLIWNPNKTSVEFFVPHKWQIFAFAPSAWHFAFISKSFQAVKYKQGYQDIFVGSFKFYLSEPGDSRDRIKYFRSPICRSELEAERRLWGRKFILYPYWIFSGSQTHYFILLPGPRLSQSEIKRNMFIPVLNVTG